MEDKNKPWNSRQRRKYIKDLCIDTRKEPSRVLPNYNGKQLLKAKLFGYQDAKCYYCKTEMHLYSKFMYDTKAATIDHIFPLGEGGSFMMHNLCLACYSCNAKKNNRILEKDELP